MSAAWGALPFEIRRRIMTQDLPKSRISVLHVTREWQADQRYGLGKSLMPLIQALVGRGHRVSYLCQEDAGRAGLDLMRKLNPRIGGWLRHLRGATQWENLCWGLMERVNMGRLAAKVAYRDDYTHVHLHDPFLALGFRLFSFWRLRRVHWGITVHGFGSYAQAFHEDGALLGTSVMRLLRRVETWIVQRCDWVIFPTTAAMLQLQRDLGLYPLPLQWQVIHHPKMPAADVTREQARAAFNWNAGDLYVLAVGRVVWLKNFPLAVRACALSGIGELRLVIVGEGDHAGLQTMAAELGFADRLEFAVTDDVVPYYRAADVYVSSSRTESFGMANLEAMVAGVPIVSTAIGGALEVLGSAASWIPGDDEEALVVALHQILTDPGFRSALVERARRRADSWPDVDRVADAYEQVYRLALA